MSSMSLSRSSFMYKQIVLYSFESMNVVKGNMGHSLSTLIEDSGSVNDGLSTRQNCNHTHLYSFTE